MTAAGSGASGGERTPARASASRCRLARELWDRPGLTRCTWRPRLARAGAAGRNTGAIIVDRRGETLGWVGGWLGGFIWVVIVSIQLLVEGRTGAGLIGLGFACVAAVVIVAFAPWRHPERPYWLLMSPVYAMFFVSVAWAVSALGPGQMGLNAFRMFLILPILLPVALAGRRRWNDTGV